MARYNLAQVQDLLRQAGWPESLIPKYAAIVMYESGGNPDAHNTQGEDSYGLLQIYYHYHPDFDRSRYNDPLYNLSYAYGIYQREHDHAWLTSVGKYNRDYQGVASQSQAIYNSGGNSDQTVYTAGTANLPSGVLGQSGVIVLLIGLGMLLILGQREQY